MIRIVTDGAADMPPQWEQEYDIHLLPLHVRFGEETYTQGQGFSLDDFYRLVRERNLIPKTSLPSIGQVKEFFQSIAQPGDTILSIHISSKLSGTFATVSTATRELSDQFHIHVIDSTAGSAAQAFLAREARLLERAGSGVPEILRRIEQICKQWAVVFTLDTLEYAYLSGRINALQNLLASALKVKPIVVLNDGLLEIAERARTRQRALDRIIERVKERTGERLINCAVVHAADPETAQRLFHQMRDCLNIQECIVTNLAIPVAANLGPGAIGIVAYPVEKE